MVRKCLHYPCLLCCHFDFQVGDERTGKSCLIKRYCEKRFVSKYLATIGIDYGATKIYVDKREVGIHIFDTSGNELFVDVRYSFFVILLLNVKNIFFRNEFYRDAHGILLVFDVAKRSSFENLSDWIREIQNELSLREGPDSQLIKPVLLVCANKTDLRSATASKNNAEVVDEIEAKLWAELHGFSYCETSAASGKGVGDMFHTFFSQIVKQQIELVS